MNEKHYCPYATEYSECQPCLHERHDFGGEDCCAVHCKACKEECGDWADVEEEA